MTQQRFTSMFDTFTFSKLEGLMLTDAIESDRGLVKWLYERDVIEISPEIQKQFDLEMGYED